jgi:hypothetical protein
VPQIRIVFPKPLLVRPGQVLRGQVRMVANRKQSYDIYTEVRFRSHDRLPSASPHDRRPVSWGRFSRRKATVISKA